MYFIGDVQGCDGDLARLLDAIDFSPSRDSAYFLGDLVNRGPDSAGVLRRLMALDGAAHAILGNHDLALLALAAGVRRARADDTAAAVLRCPDAAHLLGWLRRQPLARSAGGCLLVHAGVLPQWSADQTLALAAEVEAQLRGPGCDAFLADMYGNAPAAWDDALAGPDRWRVIVNALTRLRFCTPAGAMDFDSSESAANAPAGLVPWFDAPTRRTTGSPIAFGHWSRLGLLLRDDVLGLDTGCVWGGQLTACRWHPDAAQRAVMQVDAAPRML